MARIAAKSWVVYAKKPFKRAEHVIKYLGRYTHRVGIANSRIVDASDHAVTFRTKNGATVSLEWSDDGSTWWALGSDFALTDDGLIIFSLPVGQIRAAIASAGTTALDAIAKHA